MLSTMSKTGLSDSKPPPGLWTKPKTVDPGKKDWSIKAVTHYKYNVGDKVFVSDKNWHSLYGREGEIVSQHKVHNKWTKYLWYKVRIDYDYGPTVFALAEFALSPISNQMKLFSAKKLKPKFKVGDKVFYKPDVGIPSLVPAPVQIIFVILSSGGKNVIPHIAYQVKSQKNNIFWALESELFPMTQQYSIFAAKKKKQLKPFAYQVGDTVLVGKPHTKGIILKRYVGDYSKKNFYYIKFNHPSFGTVTETFMENDFEPYNKQFSLFSAKKKQPFVYQVGETVFIGAPYHTKGIITKRYIGDYIGDYSKKNFYHVQFNHKNLGTVTETFAEDWLELYNKQFSLFSAKKKGPPFKYNYGDKVIITFPPSSSFSETKENGKTGVVVKQWAIYDSPKILRNYYKILLEPDLQTVRYVWEENLEPQNKQLSLFSSKKRANLSKELLHAWEEAHAAFEFWYRSKSESSLKEALKALYRLLKQAKISAPEMKTLILYEKQIDNLRDWIDMAPPLVREERMGSDEFGLKYDDILNRLHSEISIWMNVPKEMWYSKISKKKTKPLYNIGDKVVIGKFPYPEVKAKIIKRVQNSEGWFYELIKENGSWSFWRHENDISQGPQMALFSAKNKIKKPKYEVGDVVMYQFDYSGAMAEGRITEVQSYHGGFLEPQYRIRLEGDLGGPAFWYMESDIKEGPQRKFVLAIKKPKYSVGDIVVVNFGTTPTHKIEGTVTAVHNFPPMKYRIKFKNSLIEYWYRENEIGEGPQREFWSSKMARWLEKDTNQYRREQAPPVGHDRKCHEGKFPTNEDFPNTWMPTKTEQECVPVIREEVVLIKGGKMKIKASDFDKKEAEVVLPLDPKKRKKVPGKPGKPGQTGQTGQLEVLPSKWEEITYATNMAQELLENIYQMAMELDDQKTANQAFRALTSLLGRPWQPTRGNF